MSKKSISLVAGVLIALALAALPGTASAEDKKLLCDAGPPCVYTVAGGELRYSFNGGEDTY